MPIGLDWFVALVAVVTHVADVLFYQNMRQRQPLQMQALSKVVHSGWGRNQFTENGLESPLLSKRMKSPPPADGESAPQAKPLDISL